MAKIVVVEHDRQLTGFLREILTEQGHEIVTASQATAFEQIQRERPDIALLDLSVWQAGGWQFAEQIKGDQLTSETKVLVWGVTAEDLHTQLAEDAVADDLHGLFEWEDDRYNRTLELQQQVDELLIRINQVAPPVLSTLLPAQWLTVSPLPVFVAQLESLCALEVAAIYAEQPEVLLCPSDLPLLGYDFAEAQTAMFQLARLGLLEPLSAEENPEFALPANHAQADLLYDLAAAVQSSDRRREFVEQMLRQEQVQQPS